jgi:hypothetical protein
LGVAIHSPGFHGIFPNADAKNRSPSDNPATPGHADFPDTGKMGCRIIDWFTMKKSEFT